MEALEKVKLKCNGEVVLLPFDLTDFDNAKYYAQKAVEAFENINMLINNGGISQRSLLAETDFSVDKKLMEVDYFGTVALTKAILSHFIKNKNGHFVTITSLMAKFGSPYRSGYSGAKHALHGFFDVLRMEHEKDGINVTLICPGFIQTNIAKNALTADGSKQNTDDNATQNGMPVAIFAKKFVKLLKQKKFEAYVEGKKLWVFS